MSPTIRYGTNFSAAHLIKRTQFLKRAYGLLELELAVVESEDVPYCTLNKALLPIRDE